MKIWNSQISQDPVKPKPYVRFEDKSIIVCKEDGDHIAYLFSFATMIANVSAKSKIENAGYSTDWAEWDKEGRMIQLLESFE